MGPQLRKPVEEGQCARRFARLGKYSSCNERSALVQESARDDSLRPRHHSSSFGPPGLSHLLTIVIGLSGQALRTYATWECTRRFLRLIKRLLSIKPKAIAECCHWPTEESSNFDLLDSFRLDWTWVGLFRLCIVFSIPCFLTTYTSQPQTEDLMVK